LDEEMLREEINSLKKANLELGEILKEVIKQTMSNQELCTQMAKSITEHQKLYNRLDEENEILKSYFYNRINNLPYEIFDPRCRHKYDMPKLMTEEETIDEIVLNRKSISRFGDGEFSVMFCKSNWSFKRDDAKLAERLREVVTSSDENILIGLNDFYGDLSHKTEREASGARSYITPQIRAEHMQLLDTERIYAQACISRGGTKEKIRNQKRIWDNKECVFIEGDKTRMGVGNDLFDNAKSIQRILCPSESAFDNYDTILKEALKLPLNKTILIALGPTASVLAYDLAKAGYHAIDIGHVDLSYEWFLRTGSSESAAVNYKYNNEYPEGYIVEDIHDEKYQSEIIADLSKI